jgi:hypothetical protein
MAMSIMNSMRSKMNHQTEEAFGSGARTPVDKKMAIAIKRHMAALKDTDLSGYTVERRRSDYSGARSDLVIYDGESVPVLSGREFNGGPTSIWYK